MAETRIRIDKQIWKSVTPGSVVVTDSNNEQQYVVPGSNGQVLQVVAGVPAWVTPAAGFSGFSITDGTTTEAIASADTITVAGSDKVTAVVSATDTITVGLDTTGASANDVLTIDGSGNVIWAPNAFDNEFTSVATLPATGETDLIYHNQADNKFYIWDGAAFVEVPTAPSFSLSMSDGTTTETLANGNTINFASSDKVTAVVSATDTVTVGLDTVGATAGQQLTFDGTNVVWGSAPIAVPANEDYIDTNLSGSVLTVTGSLTNFYYTVFRNGLRQKLGLDYTVSGQNITFTDAPISGETFAVEFRGKNTL